MRANEFITELAYKGNIGMMEMAKFYHIATPEQKAHLKELIASQQHKEAWEFLQQVTGVQLQTESYQPPSLEVGDKILKGKFKNSPAEIKGFKKDKHNQPVLKTNKGDVQLFKPRITKLMTNEAVGGVTLYHVTKTATVPSIQQKGITGMNPTNFVQAKGGQYGKIGEIFCMTNKNDAVRWAAKWEWELFKAMGKGNISIIEFQDDPKTWKVDKSDPLSQASNEGKWLKKRDAYIPPEQITSAEPVTIDMIKAARL